MMCGFQLLSLSDVGRSSAFDAGNGRAANVCFGTSSKTHVGVITIAFGSGLLRRDIGGLIGLSRPF